jgi:hypothetical protein
MRVLSLLLVCAVMFVVAVSVRPASAAIAPLDAAARVEMQQSRPPVPSNDGTRVRVQVGVLCAVVAVVVVAGTGAYFLRRRLGLTAPPPQQDAGGHH